MSGRGPDGEASWLRWECLVEGCLGPFQTAHGRFTKRFFDTHDGPGIIFFPQFSQPVINHFKKKRKISISCPVSKEPSARHALLGPDQKYKDQHAALESGQNFPLHLPLNTKGLT